MNRSPGVALQEAQDRLRLDGLLAEQLRRCEAPLAEGGVCGEWTRGVAAFSARWTAVLCERHRSPEVVARMLSAESA